MPRDDIGTHKGRWFCEGKPEDAYLGLVDDSLQRIQANTSEYARSGAHLQGPYNPHAQQHSDNLPPGATPLVGQPMPHSLNQRQAQSVDVDFDDIEDDWAYKLAQQLYYEQPDQTVEAGRDNFLLFEEEMAVLKVTARRAVDVVDIETFRSHRGLADFWDEVLEYAGY